MSPAESEPTRESGPIQEISARDPEALSEEGWRWGQVESFQRTAVEPDALQQDLGETQDYRLKSPLPEAEVLNQAPLTAPGNLPQTPDTRDLQPYPDQSGVAEYAGIPADPQVAELSLTGEEKAELPQSDNEITAWEEGRRGLTEAFQAPATEPAARQVVGRLRPLESTVEPGLPEAYGVNFFPKPAAQKLKVIGRASMVRESRSSTVESTGLQYLGPEDSFAEMPLTTRVKLSTRGESVETQGSRQAELAIRAGTTTPPNLLSQAPTTQETTLGDAPPASKEIPAVPLIPLSSFVQPTGTPVTDRPKGQPTPVPEPTRPQVQIGLLEIVVLSPESGQQHISSSSQRPLTNLASRHYLRNL
ncbi:MAG: hypothetical protein ACOZFS_04945 [Thermodesulfobacteriota bacterium]